VYNKTKYEQQYVIRNVELKYAATCWLIDW
jgi:hypothetical protein